jgi:hypothetical protein
MKQLKVTEQQFAIICTDIVLGDIAGLSPAEASARAFKRAGVKQPDESVEIVVDPGLKL